SSFSVQWNGMINPPSTGDFTFSISPINVNSTDPKSPINLTMSVSVGGNVVLNATPTNWGNQSKPVTLTAGQPVVLQVNVAAKVRSIPDGELHAVLYWQGPGISKSLVPAGNLTTAGGGAGLTATYSWTSNGQTQTVSRVEPSIDWAWTTA